MTDVTYTTIPQMTAATDAQVADTTLMEVAAADSGDSSGYVSRKMTAAQLKTYAQGTLPAEVNQLKSDLNNKANVIISSASGSIAHFEDGAEANAVSVIAHIEPVQDLHGYDNLWPAGGGKNKLPNNATNETKSANGVQIKAENGVYTITGTPTAGGSITFDLVDSVDLSPSTNNIAFLNNVANARVAVYFLRSGTNVHFWAMNPVNRVASGWTDSGNEVVNQISIHLDPAAGSNLNITVSPMLIATSETNPTSFSPYSNICPISGWTGAKVTRTGKNLANSAEWVRKAYSSDAENTIRGRLFVGAFPVGTRISISVDADFLATYKYAVHNMIKPYPLSSSSQMIDSGWKTTSTYQLATVNKYIGLCVSRKDNGEIDLDDLKAQTIMLNIGTPVDYVPFTGFETYTTDLGGTYYGGTLDVVSGVLTVDKVKWIPTAVSVGSVTMTDGNAGYKFNNYSAFSGETLVDTSRLLDVTATFLKSGVSNWVTPNSITLGNDGKSFFACLSTDIGISTVSAFNSWITTNGYYIVYPLATPQTIQLTPQQVALLVGTNNIWSDANGDTDVTYKADTKLYIEQLTKPTEDDMVANTAIQSGKFFMVGNRLFLSTSVIASGDTINPGTNCTELSLADALNNLN